MKRPLRAVMLTHSAQRAGAEIAFNRLVRAVNPEEIEVTVLSARPGPLLAAWQERRLRAQLCPQPWVLYPLEPPEEMTEAVARVRAWLDRIDPDVVLSNTTVIYAGARAAAEAGLPLVVWSHGVISPALLPGLDVQTCRLYEQSLYEMASVVTVPSPWMAGYVPTVTPQAEVRVVPNGAAFPSDWQPLSTKPELRFVMLCALEPNKRVEAVVEALAMARQRRPDLDLKLAHYGHQPPGALARIQQLVRELNVAHAVQFMGETDLPAEAYRQAFAAIIASDVESFSNVALEAQAYGRPVIATRCGGPESIIAHGETGILVARNDQESLAQTMIELASDPARAGAMGEAGRQRVEALFTVPRMARLMTEAMHAAIAGAKEAAVQARREHGRALGDQAMWRHRAASEARRTATASPPSRTVDRGYFVQEPLSRKKDQPPPRILAVGNLRLPSMELAAILPFQELMRQGRCEFLFALERDTTVQHIEWCDALFMIRPVTAEAENLWRAAEALGKPMLSFWDDDLLDVPESLACHSFFAAPEVRERIPRLLRGSAAIWFCNPRLGQAYEQIAGKPAQIMPAMIEAISPEAVERHFADDDILRIGYAGSIGHGIFVDELCFEGLQELVATVGERVELYCLGARPEIADRLPFRYIPYTADYGDYRRYFAALGLHIGLAPLPDTSFDSRKFYNKFLDYASVGACGIFSHLPPYVDIVRDGLNGLLVRNDPAAWKAALLRLVNDRDLRHQLARQAHRQVVAEHSPALVADAYAEGLVTVLGETARVAPPQSAAGAVLAAAAVAPTEQVALPVAGAALPPGGIFASRPLQSRRSYVVQPESDQWNSVSVAIGLHGRSPQGRLLLAICSSDSDGQPMRIVSQDLSQAVDNWWFRFWFAPITNSRGKRMIVEFALEGTEPGARISLYECGQPPRSLSVRARQRLFGRRGGRLFYQLGYAPQPIAG